MEREDDVQLIHAVLSGDDTAFDILVERHQKSVHSLAWRKIGDFHYAEEITKFLGRKPRSFRSRMNARFIGKDQSVHFSLTFDPKVWYSTHITLDRHNERHRKVACRSYPLIRG